jgi:bifunctional non-homologous end joining protein LigD
MTTIRANGHIIKLSHTERIYFPEDGITKRELIDYYRTIAPLFLRYAKNRLLTLQRFPEGIHGESFYQKDAPDYFPDWIKTKHIKKKTTGSDDYILCNDKATLLYLVNQSCITPHLWLSTAEKPNYPNCIIWDLDPPHNVPIDFPLIERTARSLQEILDRLGLTAWIMTTGSRGIHVRVPIRPEYTFDKVRIFARTIAQLVITHHPDTLTIEPRTIKRGTRLLIDIMRNGFGATAVAPYAVRALPTAPIATPITWNQLTKNMYSQKYTIKTIQEHLAQNGDAWKLMNRSAKSLTSALQKIDYLITR